MSEAIERAVGVYLEACDLGGDLIVRDGETLEQAVGRVFRAMLEAVREPTDEIRALFERDQMCGDGQLEKDWPDIIDALLG